jgi:hypothetical protein
MTESYAGLGRADNGRPPFDPRQEKRVCISGSGAYGQNDCHMGANWLLPEVDFCVRHIPYQYLPVAIKRRKLWVRQSADLWAKICADTPLPEIEEDEEVQE